VEEIPYDRRSLDERGHHMTPPTPTPNSISQRSISYGAASRLVAVAIAHAQSKGWRVCVAVCDASGLGVSMGRMDGVPPSVIDFASDKAFTAVMSGKSTRAFFERMSSSAELSMGLANRPRLITWEGGLPILEAGAVIGGIGVSGAAGDEDADCATQALAALGMGHSP
jgi:glc operon protein GlcG